MEIIKLKSIKKINAPSKRYELTVKDNHNFFCNGILKHNCTVTPVFGKRGFIVKKTVVVGAYVCSRNNAYKVPDNSNVFLYAASCFNGLPSTPCGAP